MINFRFHLVSLTAVFLALAAGIAIGAGVVDRQTVGFLEARLRTVENNRDNTNRENDRLRTDLDDWERFADEAGDRFVAGTLPEVAVVIVGVDGTDRDVVAPLRSTLEAAGARVAGALWLTSKWQLDEEADVVSLAEVTGASVGAEPEALRAVALEQLEGAWSAVPPSDVLLRLRDAGFVEYDAAPNGPAIEQLTLRDTDTIVLSGTDADVAAEELAVPLVVGLVETGVRVLAVEPTAPAPGADDEPTLPGVAVAARADERSSSAVSTVDNIEDFRGRLAAVLALADLREGRMGHYGTADGAARVLPEPPA